MYKIAIARPITTLMFVLALVFFGYTQIQKMPVAYLPNVDYPIVTITTNYDQGSTEVIESKITDKIDNIHKQCTQILEINRIPRIMRQIVS